MRTHLLRFIFDSAWKFESANNNLLVGAGWLIVVSLLALLTAFGLIFRKTGKLSEAAAATGFWLIVPAAAMALLILQPQFGFVTKGVPVYGYGFMMFIGFSAASWFAARRVRTIGQTPEAIWDMLMWALIPGLIGARAYYLIRHGSPEFTNSSGIRKLIAAVALWDGGIVFYGSVAGGLLGILWFCRRRRIPLLPMLDVLAPSLVLGEAFGRIGCFLYGCCYGRECELPWAVRFPPDSLTFGRLVEKGVLDPLAAATPALHPVQLYSSLNGFVLFVILSWFFRRRSFDGAVVFLAAVLYPVSRYALESLRADIDPFQIGLKDAEIFSLLLIASGLGGLWWFSRRGQLTGPGGPVAGGDASR